MSCVSECVCTEKEQTHEMFSLFSHQTGKRIKHEISYTVCPHEGAVSADSYIEHDTVSTEGYDAAWDHGSCSLSWHIR